MTALELAGSVVLVTMLRANKQNIQAHLKEDAVMIAQQELSFFIGAMNSFGMVAR